MKKYLVQPVDLYKATILQEQLAQVARLFECHWCMHRHVLSFDSRAWQDRDHEAFPPFE